jgi:hypothetical protein
VGRLHRAGRWLESKIRMARQPLGQYTGCGARRPAYPARTSTPPRRWRWGRRDRWRAAHQRRGGGFARLKGELKMERVVAVGVGRDASSGDPVLRLAARPAPLFIPRPSLPGTPAYVSATTREIDLPGRSSTTSGSGAAGCRGRRTSTSTSCARPRATTSPAPPSSATTAPSGLRAPPSRR